MLIFTELHVAFSLDVDVWNGVDISKIGNLGPGGAIVGALRQTISAANAKEQGARLPGGESLNAYPNCS